MDEIRFWRAGSAVRRVARELRRQLTPAERRLWGELRGNRLGFHFRRQHAFGPFVLDFFCAERRLCIELDGGVHEDRHEADEARTEALATRGIRVIRFDNEEVLTRTAAVLTTIEDALRT
jgi:very-short-patch-repair endonuclease